MSSRSPETDPRALLGELLRLARQESGHKTQEALARAIGMERSTVGKGEQGERVPTVHVLGDWLTACGVTGLARAAVEGVARLARNSGDDAPVKVWFSGYLTAEAVAHSIRIWQPLIVPGLVQTEAYARALFDAAGIGDDQARELIGVRLQRQEIFARPRPPNVVILLDESVLHRQVGPPEVMREQLGRLVELSRSAVIQIIPSCNAGLGGAITLLTGPGGPETLLAEALIEDQVTTDTSLVIRASATFDAVRGDGYARAHSRNLITEAIERWNGN